MAEGGFSRERPDAWKVSRRAESSPVRGEVLAARQDLLKYGAGDTGQKGLPFTADEVAQDNLLGGAGHATPSASQSMRTTYLSYVLPQTIIRFALAPQ